MARTLPWAAGHGSSSASPKVENATSTSPKQGAGRDVVGRTTPELSPRRPRKRARSRNPSTSPIQPPAEPITQVEPMRPGLSQDDKYIMVEDEFEAVARQFAAHLHAAEYARLKAKARSAPPRALPPPTSGLPATTKLGLERKHLKSKQDSLLTDLKKRQQVRGSGGSSDPDGDASDTQEYNPWSGTNLAGLMDSGEKTKTSLIGLERIDSRTRAARGYERSNSQLESMAREAKKPTIEDIFDQSSRRRDDDDDSSNDSGKVRGELQTRNTVSTSTKKSESTTATRTKKSTSHLPTSGLTHSPYRSSARSSRKRIDFDDGFDDP